jgi:uncharacterized membrane protein YhaH (DUF805 family)
MEGRISRKSYWIGIVVLASITFLLEFIADAILRATQPALPPVEVAGQAVLLGFFVTLYPNIAVTVKRLRDFDWSGWWAAPYMLLSFFVTSFSPYLQHGTPEEAATATFVFLIFGLAPLVLIGAIPGTAGQNRFGPPPA